MEAGAAIDEELYSVYDYISTLGNTGKRPVLCLKSNPFSEWSLYKLNRDQFYN